LVTDGSFVAAELHVLLCDTATWSTLLCGALRAFLGGWRAHALDRFMLTHICTRFRASHRLWFLPPYSLRGQAEFVGQAAV